MSENNTQKQHRLLKISILRYNPADPASVPHMQTFELEESDSMTLFIALNVRLRVPCRYLRFLRHDDQR